MEKQILVEYKGGISKMIGLDEERLEYEQGLSLNALLLKIHNSHAGSLDHHDSIHKHSVLLMLNGIFVPSSDFDKTIVHEGDRVTLFPPVAGG